MGWFSFLRRQKYKPEEPTSPRPLYTFSGGTQVNPDTAMKASAFYSGVIYISTQIAKLPWDIKDNENNIIENDISRIIRLRPNDEMNSFTWRLLMLQQALVLGNGYSEIVRSVSGAIKALYPIPAQNVQLTRVNGQLFYRIVGGSITGNGDVYLLPADIFHIKNFYTKDGLTGQGLAHYGAETLGITIGADKFANSLYTNGGMPSGILSVEGTLSPDAAIRLKETWSETHGGRKVGGTAVLEEGIKYSPISFAPDVLQFLDSRKFSVLEIARFLRINPQKLYDTDSQTYNNIEHANLEVAIDTLDAWARNFEIEADIKLLNSGHGGKRTEMDLYAVFRGDMETRSQYFQRMMQSSALTPNEIRKREGMAPYKKGDRFYIATNNFSPVDRLDEMLDSQIKAKSEPQETKVEQPEQAEPVKVENKIDESDIEVNQAIVKYLQTRTN